MTAPESKVVQQEPHSSLDMLDPTDLAFLDLVHDAELTFPGNENSTPQSRSRVLGVELGVESDHLPVGKVALSAALRRHPSSRSNGTELLSEVIVDKFEREKYAYEPPDFASQCLDPTRTRDFEFAPFLGLTRGGSEADFKMKEIEGLRELRAFLEKAIMTDVGTLTEKDEISALQDRAGSILESLTFIGDREFQNAVSLLGSYWMKYLTNNPQNRIHIVTGVSESTKYPGEVKSDKHLLGKVITNYFGEDVDPSVAERLRIGTDGLEDADPEHTKVIFLEDWALSGSQMSRSYSDFMDNLELRKHADNIEINFIVATPDRIRLGTGVEYVSAIGKTHKRSLPTKAVYKSKQSNVKTPESNDSHITGLHSTANYGFMHELNRMYRMLNLEGVVAYPALATIISRYDDNPVKLHKDMLEKNTDNEGEE